MSNKTINIIQHLNTTINKIREIQSDSFKEQYLLYKTSNIVIKSIELLTELIKREE